MNKYTLDENVALMRGVIKQWCPFQGGRVSCGQWCPMFELLSDWSGKQARQVKLNCSPGGRIIDLETPNDNS